MDFSDIIPREKHEALWYLGTHGKPKIRPLGDGRHMIISIESMPPAPEHIKKPLDNLIRFASDVTGKTVILMLTRAMQDGPKFFRPTAMQCEAMEHMSIDMDVNDFSMPYNHLFVVLPKDYREQLKKRFPNSSVPKAMLVWEDKDYRIIGVVAFSADSEICCLLPERPGVSIEERLRERGNINPDSLEVHGEEFNMTEMLERVALNMALVLEGERSTLKPTNPKAVEKRKKLFKSSNPKDRAEAQRLRIRETSEILLDQSIQFYEEKSSPSSEPQGGTHASPRPHWRKGHFRMQAHGVGRLMRKRIRIKPILVRRSNLVLGETSSTVTYTSKE